ncbi:MAG TPA: formyltetrahydrofolate deformylase [Halieaceae bacterium]|nr:formyltetrahydrofolate deformylase [Halieaceae bacterium]
MSRSHILKFACPDRVGLVAGLAKLMERHDCFIAASRTFGDAETGRFFARLVFHGTSDALPSGLETDLATMAQELCADWSVHPEGEAVRTLLMVSKSEHCANTLLYAARRRELPIDIVGIVSNNETLRDDFAHWGLPWFHVPVAKETKPEAEARLFDIVEETGADLVVLARYMQVLSDEACRRLELKCINIHHSFLPGFKGARPYHQAYDRGVKVIGATAHYVTSDLDEGPIIAQEVKAIDHQVSVEQMIHLGHDTEATALSHAVRLHCEERVQLNGQRTVIL